MRIHTKALSLHPSLTTTQGSHFQTTLKQMKVFLLDHSLNNLIDDPLIVKLLAMKKFSIKCPNPRFALKKQLILI